MIVNKYNICIKHSLDLSVHVGIHVFDISDMHANRLQLRTYKFIITHMDTKSIFPQNYYLSGKKIYII
jgi:hypothetical protein